MTKTYTVEESAAAGGSELTRVLYEKMRTQDEAIQAVGGKLQEIEMMMQALHEISANVGAAEAATLVTAVQEFAKRIVHIADACHVKFGQLPSGAWKDEFEEDEPEAEEVEAEEVEHG